MENVTKALMLVAAVLVAIIIVSLGIYIYIYIYNQSTIPECVCIRSKSMKILENVTNNDVKYALNGRRSYGIRYPSNIYQMQDWIDKKSIYFVVFNYNDETGKINEIWINDWQS